MNFLRTFAVGLASFACALAVSALIWLATLSTTIMQPDVVKGWLRDSGVYAKIVPTFVSSNEQNIPNNTISPEVTKTALTNTFTPGYVQEHSEKTIDSVYQWLEGKSDKPTFSIPVDEKRTTFIEQLALAAEPHVASLPVCSRAVQVSADSVSCRPPGMTTQQFAQMLAAETVTNSQVLNKPLTEETLAASQQQDTGPQVQPAGTQSLSQLPATFEVIRWLLVALPIGIVLCLGIIALAAADRLVAFARLSRRIFFGTLFTLIAAGILLYFSANPQALPNFGTAQNGGVVEIFTPVLQKAIGTIAGQLALLSGIGAAVSGAAWLVLSIFRRRRAQVQLQPEAPSAPTETPKPPMPPSTPKV